MPLLFANKKLDGFGASWTALADGELVSATDDVCAFQVFAELELADRIPDRGPLRVGDFRAPLPGNLEKRLAIVSAVIEP